MNLVGKIRADRRQGERRLTMDLAELLASHVAFDRFERLMFKLVDRRKTLRRDRDVQRAIARIDA
jgi:hypothetical protein